MKIYLKYIIFVSFVFTGLYLIIIVYSSKMNVYGMDSLIIRAQALPKSTPLSLIKKNKVHRNRNIVSKIKASPKPQKKKMTPLPTKMAPQMKKMAPPSMKKSSQIKKMVPPSMKKSPQMKKMAPPSMKKSPQMKKTAPFSSKKSQMKISLSAKSNGRLQDNRRLLAVLATTWLPEKEKETIHENVARVWGSWPGIVQPVLYTNLSMTDKSFDRCMQYGWKFSPILQTNCAGIPILKNMVTDLMKNFPNSDFYGFVNSDILFDPGLIETFEFVKKHTKERPVMLIGQRTNVNFTNPLEVHSPTDVPRLAKQGQIMRAYAIDYFLTDRSFPWDKFPDLVIGRHQYDNYMVHFSLMQKALVIDVTKTVKAVHQTTKDGNNSGNGRHDKNCNRNMIKAFGKPFYSSWGFVTCARKYTHKNKSRNMVMSSRKPWKYCKPDELVH